MQTLLEQMRQKKGNSKRAVMRSLKPQILAALADYSKHEVYETLVANGQFDGHYTTFCRYLWKWELEASEKRQRLADSSTPSIPQATENLTVSPMPETDTPKPAIKEFQLRTYDRKDLV